MNRGIVPVHSMGGHVLAHLVGSQHQEVEVGLFGELNAASLRDHISLHFGYGYAASDLIPPVTTGTGAVSASDNMLVVSGGDGTAHIQTRRKLLYRPGHTIIVGGTAAFTGTSGTGEIGLFDDDYGFRWGVDVATGVPYFIREFNGVPVPEIGTADYSAFDFSKLNIWRIRYGYYGVAAAVFEFMIPGTQRWLVAHEFNTHGVIDTPHSFPNLPVRVAATAGCTVKTASFQAGTLGGNAEVGFRQFAADDWVAIGDTDTETAVAVFRSSPTFNGETNGILSRLLKAVYASNLEGVAVVRIYYGATLAGAEGVDYDWVDVAAGDSVVQLAVSLGAGPQPDWSAARSTDAQYIALGAVPGSGATTSGGDASFQQTDLWAGETAVITVERLTGTTAYSLGYAMSWREYQ